MTNTQRGAIATWEQAMDNGVSNAFFAFEAVDFWGDDLSDEAQDIVASATFLYLIGLYTTVEWQQHIECATACDYHVFTEYARFVGLTIGADHIL